MPNRARTVLTVASTAENRLVAEFKLALVQMRVEGGCKAANLERAARLVKEAAENEAQVVLLPEAMDLGWTHPSAHEAESIPVGKSCARLRELAREHHLFVCSGLVERAGEPCFNAACWLILRARCCCIIGS